MNMNLPASLQVKELSTAGMESLILSSVMGLEDYGFSGSEKGLQFLGDRSELKNLFVAYCSGKYIACCKIRKTSFYFRMVFWERGSIYYFYCKGLHAVLPGMHFLPPNLKF